MKEIHFPAVFMNKGKILVLGGFTDGTIIQILTDSM
jgi:hypothetical protein